jgi:hypothetical protein
MYVMHAEWRALFAERFPKIDQSQIQPSPFEATRPLCHLRLERQQY